MSKTTLTVALVTQCLANKHSSMYQFVSPLKPANFVAVVVILKVHVPLRKVPLRFV